MPVMGGKEMADTLRTSHPDTKVLFTSGYTQDALGHQGVLRPGIRFLQKPYMTATLARKVREVLDEGLIQSR
jgi:FixJ family two-component response regulator